MLKGASLPIEFVVILAIAVIAMVVFLLFYFGILQFSTEGVGDISGNISNPLLEEAEEEAECIGGLGSGCNQP